MQIHIVSEGETISSIASQYRVSVERIIYDNQLASPDTLVVGQALLILIPELTHQVRSGETIYSIASLYHVTAKSLYQNNPYLLFQPYLLEGSLLVIRYTGMEEGNTFINGYAYPFIERHLLYEELLYLSEISIFSYGFTADGDLITIEDDPLIQAAQENGVDPILTLTPLDENGSFNNYLVHLISSNLPLQNKVIEQLTEIMLRKGYAGIDIDFEYIQAEDRDSFSAFVGRVTEHMNNLGLRVSVALAPKERADFPGLLYEGIDYEALGQNANNVLLMTYEWGYSFGPPMAVAPINKVRQILDYGVSAIPSYKVNMGIPNYGYDWALPYERGVTKATTISNIEAIEIAAANHASIQYDTTAQSPFFEYRRDGVNHIVWFEDVRSIYQKLSLIPEYRLMGAGYWSLMKPFRSNWLLLHSLFHIDSHSEIILPSS